MPRKPTRPFMLAGERFDIDARYQLIKQIGKGAYGLVCSCRDTQDGAKVAVKKVSDTFNDEIDAKRTLREIKLLKHLKHENVIPILDIQPPANKAGFQDVYMITELMDTDLHQIIRSPQQLSDEHTQYFVYQLFCGLKYIHSANVMHRDLKPGNLLVNRNCDLKICDFGLARYREHDDDPVTEYVVTRWYRAPELILTRDYDKSIDMWSAGCILAELLGRKPIFPGKNYILQLETICNVIGTPKDDQISHITSDKARRHVRNLKSKRRVPFEKLYPGANPEAIQMLEQILNFEPSKRITAQDALEHAYLASHHDEEHEPTAEDEFTFDFDYEDKKLTKDDWRELVLDDIIEFHPEVYDDFRK